MTDHTTLVHSLLSCICPACGGPKKSKQTLCYRDYKRLPADQKSALYSPIGRGYEQAFARAMTTLGVERPSFPPEVR